MLRAALERLEARDVPSAASLFAVGSGGGGTPRLKVYDTATGAVLGDFLAYENTFDGGVTAATGDVNNDGFPDVIVGAGPGGGPRVRVFDGRAFRPAGLSGTGLAPVNGTAGMPDNGVIADFFAYESTQRGGTFVTAGNFVGISFADVVVGAGPGGGPRVRVLDGQFITARGRAFTSDLVGDTVANFFAFESTFRNGVTVSATPGALGAVFSDLVVAPGFGGGPRVRVLAGGAVAAQLLNYTSNNLGDGLADFFAGSTALRTGLFVSTADYNSDGFPDVAVGTGPGTAGTVTLYNGAAIRSSNAGFTGTRPGDVLYTFTTNTSNGNVTVGSAQDTTTLQRGLLLVGVGGAGVPGRATVYRFTQGGTLLVPQTVYDLPFATGFLGGVNVSN